MVNHRDPKQEKNWVALVDGENQQLRILGRMAKRQGVDLTIIVDIIHVIEYWDFHETCEHKRNHQALYQEGEVPPTKLPQSSFRRDHLKVIK